MEWPVIGHRFNSLSLKFGVPNKLSGRNFLISSLSLLCGFCCDELGKIILLRVTIEIFIFVGKFLRLDFDHRKIDRIEMSKLDDVAYVDTLQIQTVSGDTTTSIFANGRNQTAIQVIIKAVTKDDKPFKSVDELSQGLFLCFADDGSKLNWNGKNGWTYTNVQGEYNGETQSPSNVGPTTPTVADDGTMIFKWFVSSTNVETRRVSVGLRTSTKLFTTADNASGAEKSSVRIEAGPPIDYSDRNNIEIKLGAFETLDSNLHWFSDFNTDDEKHHVNGISTKRIAYIHPASQTRQTKFKTFNIDYARVDTPDLDEQKNGYINLFVFSHENARPCAVIGRSQGNENFQILVAYSRQNDVQLEGFATANKSDQLFRFHIQYIYDKNFGVDEHGIPSLLLYQFSYPVGVKTTLYKWKSAVHQPTVQLTDFYGNQGSIRLVFNDNNNFDGPGIF